MVRITIPLVEFVDIAFIRESLTPFMENLKANYKASMMTRFYGRHKKDLCNEYKKKRYTSVELYRGIATNNSQNII